MENLVVKRGQEKAATDFQVEPKSAGTGIGTPGQVQDGSQAGILVDEECCQQPQPRHMVTKLK